VSRASRSVKRLTRHAPLRAANEVNLTDEIWRAANEKAIPQRGEWRFNGTPVRREIVNVILSRRGMELMDTTGSEVIACRRVSTLARTTEKEMATAFRELKKSITDGIPARLTPAIKDRVWQTVKRHARRLTKHSSEEKVLKLRSALDDPQQFKEQQELRHLAFEVLDIAIHESTAPVSKGNPPSPYDMLLRDLAWVFKDGGGKITYGSISYASPFTRWVFELLKCLPTSVGPMLDVINNRVMNMKLAEQELPEPVYATR
jgi:hypothetical protein